MDSRFLTDEEIRNYRPEQSPSPADVVAEVGQTDDRGRRLVVAKLGNEELYRNKIDTDLEFLRAKYCESLAKAFDLKWGGGDDFAWFGDRILHATREAIAGEQIANVETLHRTFTPITTADLIANSPRPNYLIEDVLVEQQPMLMGGTFKSLKTSIATAMAVSLATGTDFLGKFAVPRAVNVGIFSGESGRHTLAETTARIAASAGIDPERDLDRLLWSMDVPRLTNLLEVDALQKFVEGNSIEVLIVDPLYQAMADASQDAANVFAMGAALRPLTELTTATGCTLILVHHTSRGATRLRGFEPPELGDLSFSGTAEFCRQWLLLGRRSTYQPGSGSHELWATCGGSAGHSGLYGVTVNEGTHSDFGGRRWSVTVEHADEVRQDHRQQRDDALEQQRTERAEQRLMADSRALVRAMIKHPDGETKRVLRDIAGLSGDRTTAAMAHLLQAGEAVPCDVFKGAKKAPLEGYKLKHVEGV